MAEDIEGRVRRVVSRQLRIDESKLSPEARFVQDLGADSLKSLELIAAFEEEFDLDMDMDEAVKIQTVGEAIEFIKKELEKA